MRIKVALVLAAACALPAFAGSATAAGHGPAAHLLKGKALVRQSALYLGISARDLRLQLRTGKSIAQVADATAGKSSDGLLATLSGAAKAKLDGLVAAGKLKPERESKVLDRITLRLQKAINRVHAART